MASGDTLQGQRIDGGDPYFWPEGSYGRFLLRGDVVRRPVGFGYGGRPKPLPGLGWGVEVDSIERK